MAAESVIGALNVREMDPRGLRASATNARTHSDRQVAQIAASIERFGFANPVLARVDGAIVAGHGRVLAALKLGLAAIPVIVLEHLTEAAARALALADNRIALESGWDAELLRAELEALDEDPLQLGFAGDEIAKLFAAPETIAVTETSVEPVQDRFWISVRGPLADQAQALQRLADLMGAMPAVEVEIGTTAIG